MKRISQLGWGLGLLFWLSLGFCLSLQALDNPDLPPLKIHPLPPSLQALADPKTDDYFDQLPPSPLGYLIWSRFPITVYVDQSPNPQDSSAANQRFLQWTATVKQAIADWNRYLPLQIIPHWEDADIQIRYQEPPLTPPKNPKTGQISLPRARNAQTRYQFYTTEENPPILRHRMTIEIKPGLGRESTLATARHEFGHALGIWGHSPNPQDVLYVSATKETPPISIRDVNTLMKIYQQPTRLGWPLPKP